MISMPLIEAHLEILLQQEYSRNAPAIFDKNNQLNNN